jgi:hypothetical protein
MEFVIQYFGMFDQLLYLDTVEAEEWLRRSTTPELCLEKPDPHPNGSIIIRVYPGT